MRGKILVVGAFLFFAGNMAWTAQAEISSEETASEEGMSLEAFEASLSYQEGPVELPGKIATLQLENGFRYLNPEDTERVLVDAWGNPPGNESLGMILTPGASATNDTGFGVIVRYEQDGYVSDEDADSIDYSDLLKGLKEETEESNKFRAEGGYETVQLIGWAEPPSYAKDTHKMYWAKELRFGDSPVHTLNYNVRVLGRKGVLVMNAVSEMGQLEAVQREMKTVQAFTEFTSGNRYEEFDPKNDQLANYGLAALVGGAAAAKMGLFTKLWLMVLAFKKAIILGFAAAGAFIARLLGRKKSAPGEPAS